MEELLPAISIPEMSENSLDPNTLFGTPRKEIWFEIGFGGGEHLAGQASANPENGLLGAEPFQEGVGKILSQIHDEGISNVRLYNGDARPIVTSLKTASLDRVFILFPDPWHKARHNKRRLIQPEFIEDLARVIKPGASLRFATDWADYADWTLERFEASPLFTWNVKSVDDWKCQPVEHIPTRYQLKKLGDCDPIWLDFVRVD